MAIAGRDILARAKNGTGKTGAYLIPLLQLVNPALRHVQGLLGTGGGVAAWLGWRVSLLACMVCWRVG